MTTIIIEVITAILVWTVGLSLTFLICLAIHKSFNQLRKNMKKPSKRKLRRQAEFFELVT